MLHKMCFMNGDETADLYDGEDIKMDNINDVYFENRKELIVL